MGLRLRLKRSATPAHGLWVCIKALLHSFEQMLMPPWWNPPALAEESRAFAPTSDCLGSWRSSHLQTENGYEKQQSRGYDSE